MRRGNRVTAMLVGAGAALLLATGAQAAATSIIAARVGAVDPIALAKFYETVYGLKEVNRFKLSTGVEIVLSFGDSSAAGKANRGTELFVNHRDSDAIEDPIPHVILRVENMAATIEAIKANGGSIQTKPFKFQNALTIGIARDPAGNLVEMLEMPGPR